MASETILLLVIIAVLLSMIVSLGLIVNVTLENEKKNAYQEGFIDAYLLLEPYFDSSYTEDEIMDAIGIPEED